MHHGLALHVGLGLLHRRTHRVTDFLPQTPDATTREAHPEEVVHHRTHLPIAQPVPPTQQGHHRRQSFTIAQGRDPRRQLGAGYRVAARAPQAMQSILHHLGFNRWHFYHLMAVRMRIVA